MKYNITAKLDEIANQIEREYPKLALRIDKISDRLDRIAGVSLLSRSEAIKTLKNTFKNNPKNFVEILNKIIYLVGSDKTKIAGNFWSTLKAIASPKVVLSILTLLVSAPSAADIMTEIFSEIPDTSVGHQNLNKGKIREITGKKSLSPDRLKGSVSGSYQWLVDDALKWWSTVDGVWDFSDYPFRYSSSQTAVGVGFGSSRARAKATAYQNAYHSLSVVDTEYDSFEKEEEGVWVAICVMGMSKELQTAVKGLAKNYDHQKIMRLLEEAQAEDKKRLK